MDYDYIRNEAIHFVRQYVKVEFLSRDPFYGRVPRFHYVTTRKLSALKMYDTARRYVNLQGMYVCANDQWNTNRTGVVKIFH